MQQNKLKILIIDHNIDDIEFLFSLLHDTYVLMYSTTREVTFEILEQESISLILLKSKMPSTDSIKLIEAIKLNNYSPYLPVIVIADDQDPQYEVAAFKYGAIDYIIKPFLPAILKARIKLHIDLKIKINALEENTMLDDLTGLPNQRYLDNYIQQFFTSTIRNKQSLSFILIDIDHLHEFNQFYGHDQGNKCLQKVSLKLQSLISRPHDIVARNAQGQFMLVLPETDKIGALFIAETIVAILESTNIKHLQVPEQRVTVSMALLSYDAKTSKVRISILGILRILNDTLVKAKLNGRNRIEVTHL